MRLQDVRVGTTWLNSRGNITKVYNIYIWTTLSGIKRTRLDCITERKTNYSILDYEFTERVKNFNYTAFNEYKLNGHHHKKHSLIDSIFMI